jgi:hypothetical protein
MTTQQAEPQMTLDEIREKFCLPPIAGESHAKRRERLDKAQSLGLITPVDRARLDFQDEVAAFKAGMRAAWQAVKDAWRER